MHDSQTKEPIIEYLSDAQVEQIHERSLDILENTGIEVDHEEGLKLLEQNGASVDQETRRARIPRDLVARCLETAPEEFTLAARSPEKDCHLEPGGQLYYRNAGAPDLIVDLETGGFRPLTTADMRNVFKLLDALDGISIVTAVFAHDMPEVGRDILMLREAFSSTDKPIHMRTFSGETLKHMLEMAAVVAGGKDQLKERPIVSLLEAPVQPLRFIDVMVDGLLLCGEYGVPLEVCVMPIAGATGPVTMAGNLQLLNTEFLGAVVISQLAHPGAPLTYAPRPMVMDMRTGFSLAGSIEGAITAVAGVQMAHYYNVPVSVHGPWSDSVTHDGQSIFEHTYTALMGAFAGVNILVGAGMIQESLAISHEQLVIDDEINRTAFRALEGFQVDEERQAIEAIARVGPGGNFLADEHTLKFLREERYVPSLLYRGSREAWEQSGSKTFVERAREKARAILREHEPNPLPDDTSKALNELVDGALKSLQR